MTQPASPDRLAFLSDSTGRAVLDVTDALDRIMGDRQLLARMLVRFREQYRPALSLLRAHLTQGEREPAHRLAHTLKGASGMIGASTVQAAADQLEVLLRMGQDDPAPAVERLAAAMDELMAVLARVDALADTPPSPRAQGDSAALLRELDALLEAGDGDAVDLVEQAAPALRAVLGETSFARLAEAVRDFDFDAARAALGPGRAPGPAVSG